VVSHPQSNVDQGMAIAHALALQGWSSVILEDIRERHLTMYEEYVKVVTNDERVTGPDQLEFGDFLIQPVDPEDS